MNSSSYGEKFAKVSYTEKGVTKTADFSYYVVKLADPTTLPDTEIDELVFASPPSKSAWGFDEVISDWASAVVLAYKADNNDTPYVRVNNAGLTFSVGETGTVPAQGLDTGQNRVVPSIKAKLTNTQTKNATFQNWAITVHNVKLVNSSVTKYATVEADSFVYGTYGFESGVGAQTLWAINGQNPFSGSTLETVALDEAKLKVQAGTTYTYMPISGNSNSRFEGVAMRFEGVAIRIMQC